MPPRALVCYHYPCPDGIFAALAASVYHRQREMPVQYVPLTTWDKPGIDELQLQVRSHAGRVPLLMPFSNHSTLTPSFTQRPGSHVGASVWPHLLTFMIREMKRFTFWTTSVQEGLQGLLQTIAKKS